MIDEENPWDDGESITDTLQPADQANESTLGWLCFFDMQSHTHTVQM